MPTAGSPRTSAQICATARSTGVRGSAPGAAASASARPSASSAWRSTLPAAVSGIAGSATKRAGIM